MRPYRLLSIALALTGCSSESVVPELVCPAANVPLCAMPAAQREALGFLTLDARVRSAAALSNATGRAALTSELTTLQQSLADQHIGTARTALDRAIAAIATARAANVAGDAPDLGAIDLSLSHISQAIR